MRLIILGLMLMQRGGGENEHCAEVKNIEDIDKCPTTRIKWDKAARKKACATLIFESRKNCSKGLNYHCLINSYRNRTVEMCAPNTFISGGCTEFNDGAHLIQKHRNSPCDTSGFPNCSVFYESTESYLYQGCYELVKKPASDKSDEGYSNNSLVVGLCTGVGIFILLIVIGIAVVVKRKTDKKEKRQKSTSQLEGNEEATISLLPKVENPDPDNNGVRQKSTSQLEVTEEATISLLQKVENPDPDEIDLESCETTDESNSIICAGNPEPDAMNDSSEDYSLVCAIDLGTTFSGIAYSLREKYKRDPLDIEVPIEWKVPSYVQTSSKTPTTLLLDKDKKFLEFGYKADIKYAELAEDEENTDYFYIRRFKMMLYDTLKMEKKLTREMMIKDITGKKEIKAIIVFQHAIKYFRDLMLETIDKKVLSVKESSIKWVLTVPAIWSDEAKQFMIEAAKLAGIKRRNLTLALEPEAASIYCSRLPLSKFVNNDGLDTFEVGKKYLVLDAGGGTVDITVHEVMKDNTLKELEKASGGEWGGNNVDGCFMEALTEIVTLDVMEAFRLKYTGEYIDIFHKFEMKKRTMSKTEQTLVMMKMPVELSELYTKMTKKPFEEAVKNSKYSKTMKWESQKLFITSTLFEEFFAKACSGISTHVRNLLGKPKVQGTNTILMFGGFSESSILQECMRKDFPNYRIVIPDEPSLAVLKGAVLFGHNSSLISERLAKYWYGIATFQKYDPNIHRMENKHEDYCMDLFQPIIVKESPILANEEQSYGPYEPNRDDQNEMDFKIYVSDSDPEPKYVTDSGCRYLGKLTIKFPEGKKGKKRSVSLSMKLNESELLVKVTDNCNGSKTFICDLLCEEYHNLPFIGHNEN